MLEARLSEAALLKRLLDSVKELVTDANFECNEEGINLQAMDNSHVALVSVCMKATGFKKYRCDRPMPLGVNIGSLTKVLKCAKDDDACILTASDDADVLRLTYEAKTSDRIAEYDMKLMDIDAETLGIPDTEYDAEVTMPSSEFSRIVRDLAQLGESVRIDVSKEGIRFISEGESANGNILLKQSDGKSGSSSKQDGDSDNEEEQANESEDESSSPKKKVKKEKVKKEDGDVEMGDEDEEDQEFEEPEQDDEEEEEEEDTTSKKRKKAPAKNGKAAKKAKKEDEDEEVEGVSITMSQHVSLTFSLKYLVNISKSTPLSKSVKLKLSNDVPLLVDYNFGKKLGFIRYYLAPKIGDD